MKKFEIKDLLDPVKLKQLDEECKELKVERTREGEIKHKEKIEKQDNQTRLNQMNQEGDKMLEWGVEPEE